MFPEFCACKRAQSCSTLCNPIDCSTPGSSVHGNFLARILEWVAISFSLYKHKNSKSHKNDLSSFYILYAYICVCVCMYVLFLKYTTWVWYLSQLTLLLEIFIQKCIKQSLCFSIDITFPRYSHGPWRATSKKYYQVVRKLKKSLKHSVRELYINKENKDLYSNCVKRICGCEE